MTDAQWKVKVEQISADADYERRRFRKECVTRGIVEFVRRKGCFFYEVKYRGCLICRLYKNIEQPLKLLAVWNTITISEENF